MEFFQLKRGYTSVAETPAVLQWPAVCYYAAVSASCLSMKQYSWTQKQTKKQEINLAKPVSNYAKKREKNIRFTCTSLINMPFLTLGSPTR